MYLSLALLLPIAHARVLDVTTVTASSSLTGDADVSYDVANVTDRKASSVWVEGEDGSGLGSWVEVDLGAEKSLTGFRLWNGNWYSTDYWKRHNRIKDVEVSFSDGSKQTFVLKDEMTPEDVRFKAPVKSSKLRIKVMSVYRGSTFNDTCISEVQVQDGGSEPHVAPTALTASSVYPADADGSYDARNVDDRLADSMWCEGAKDGDGTGEWLEFDFGASRKVGKLRLINGNGYSFAFNMKGNRAKTATLSFSDGSTETIALKSSFKEQTVEFAPHSTRKVKVTFTEVSKGSESNDLCVSEAAFLE